MRLEYLLGEGETWEALVSLLATVPGLPVPVVAVRPGVPRGLTLAAQSGSHISAAWLPPLDDGGGGHRLYELRFREQGTAVWTTVQVAGLSYQLLRLDPATTYEAQVRAHNAIGFGPWTPVETETTSALFALLLENGDYLLLETGL